MSEPPPARKVCCSLWDWSEVRSIAKIASRQPGDTTQESGSSISLSWPSPFSAWGNWRFPLTKPQQDSALSSSFSGTFSALFHCWLSPASSGFGVTFDAATSRCRLASPPPGSSGASVASWQCSWPSGYFPFLVPVPGPPWASGSLPPTT